MFHSTVQSSVIDFVFANNISAAALRDFALYK